MKCKKFSRGLPGYYYGDISREEKKLIEDHLRVCPTCRRELESLEKLFSRLAREPSVAFTEREKDELRHRVRVQTVSRPSGESRPRSRSFRLLPLGLAVPAAAAVIILALLVSRPPGVTETPDLPVSASTELVEFSENVEEELNSVSEICREIDGLQQLFAGEEFGATGAWREVFPSWNLG